jgi:DNA-binding IclR family transcriptional regulator
MDGKERAAAAEGPTYKVNVLDRAISVLQAFSVAKPQMSLAEISRATGLHRSTALRLLSTLTHSGLVIRDEDTGHYSLGYELIALAEVARAGTDISDWARPVMKDIRDQLNETVVLSVRSGDHRVDIDQAIANQPIRRVIALGEHKLLTFGAPSLSIMSALPEVEAEAILERLLPRAYEAYPDFDPAQFRERLAKIRETGYHEQRSELGPGSNSASVGIAGPVFGRRGEVVASLGVSVPSDRMTPELRDQVIRAVLDGCRAIASRMGRGASAA